MYLTTNGGSFLHLNDITFRWTMLQWVWHLCECVRFDTVLN